MNKFIETWVFLGILVDVFILGVDVVIGCCRLDCPDKKGQRAKGTGWLVPKMIHRQRITLPCAYTTSFLHSTPTLPRVTTARLHFILFLYLFTHIYCYYLYFNQSNIIIINTSLLLVIIIIIIPYILYTTGPSFTLPHFTIT